MPRSAVDLRFHFSFSPCAAVNYDAKSESILFGAWLDESHESCRLFRGLRATKIGSPRFTLRHFARFRAPGLVKSPDDRETFSPTSYLSRSKAEINSRPGLVS
jgi:hypothetical protein